MALGQLTPILRIFDEAAAKAYKNARPSIQEMPWGSQDMPIDGPFGNRLIFTSAVVP